MSKLKKLELKKGQILYKRDYTHYMAVRLGSSDKMNEYKKNEGIWPYQQFEISNDPIIRKQSQSINPVRLESSKQIPGKK